MLSVQQKHRSLTPGTCSWAAWLWALLFLTHSKGSYHPGWPCGGLPKSLPCPCAHASVDFVLSAKWKHPFDRYQTRKQESFFLDQRTPLHIPMMRQKEMHRFLYDQEASCTVLQIKYSGTALLLLVLPDPGKMQQVEAALQPETLRRWGQRFLPRWVPLRCCRTSWGRSDQPQPQEPICWVCLTISLLTSPVVAPHLWASGFFQTLNQGHDTYCMGVWRDGWSHHLEYLDWY